MVDQDAGMPRVYLARHGNSPGIYSQHQTLIFLSIGETEWTKSGRYTGITELELTTDEIKQVLGSGQILIGPGKLIVSPRKRAQATIDLLFDELGKDALGKETVTMTEELAKWDYGANMKAPF